MDHKTSQRQLRKYNNMLEEVGIDSENIKRIGDIETIIKAEKMLKEDKNSVKIKDFFGECVVEGTNTLDFLVDVKSSSSRRHYEISVKLSKYPNEAVYQIDPYGKPTDHSCRDTRLNQHIRRLGQPCRHQVMASIFLERRAYTYLKRKGYDVEILKMYERVSKGLINLYNLLVRDSTMDSADRKKMLYVYSKMRLDKKKLSEIELKSHQHDQQASSQFPS